MMNTRARERLYQLIEVEKTVRQSEFARVVGVKQPAVWGWLNGRNRPKSHLRNAIARHYGIPASDWETDDERRQSIGSEAPPPGRSGTTLPRVRSTGTDDS